MTSLKLPPEFEGTFEMYIKMYEILGVDIYGKESKIFTKILRKIIFYTIIFLSTASAIICLVNVYKTDNNILEKMKMMMGVYGFLQVPFNLILVAMKKNQIKELVLDIAEIWPEKQQQSKENLAMIKNWTRLPKKVYINMLVPMMLVSFLYHLVPVIATFYNRFTKSDSKFLLCFEYYPIDIKTVPCYLCVAFLQWFLSTNMYYVAHVSCVLLFGSLVFNLSLLFKLLQNDLKNIFPPRAPQPTNSFNSSDDDKYIELVNIIKIHQKILKLSQKINKIFGLIIFVPTVSYGISLSFCAFLTMVENWFNGNFVFTIFLEIYVLTWPGQLIDDSSSGIADAAYQSLWYEQSLRIRKAILFIIIRSQVPATIHPLDFMELNLVTCAKFLSTAWTYVSVANEMYSGDI